MRRPASLDPIAAELIRAGYRHTRRSFVASLLVVLFLANVAAMHWPGSWVGFWLAAYLGWHVAEELLVRRFRRAAPTDEELAPWSRAAALALAISGLIWGIGFNRLVAPQAPLTIGLIICAMAAITAGSIGYRSTILAGFYAHNGFVSILLAWRFFAESGPAFRLLGVSTLVYGVVIAFYGRAQHALIRDSLRIRFSNDALLAAVQVEKRAADEARKKAEAASLTKSQFLAAASHDLRQPLYALNLFSASLSSLRLDQGAQTVVHGIQGSVAAMESLFVRLLDLSKFDAGVIRAVPVPVAVDDLFDRLSSYSSAIAAARGIDLRFRSNGEIVTSDDSLLEQVLSNLVANAIRYTAHGAVLVAARRRAGVVRFEVWDTGIGISAEDRERIFDEFVQVGNERRDREKGLGLGLAIARRAAQLIDARIDLHSQPGRGSRFSLTQPAAAPSSMPVGGRSDVRPAMRWDRDLPILVVEDDAQVSAALAMTLEGWQLGFTIVADAQAALAAVAGGARFGLVISDYRLGGGIDGLDLIGRLVTRHAELRSRCILLTGDVDPAVIAAAAAQSVPLLMKPLAATDLKALLFPRPDHAVDG